MDSNHVALCTLQTRVELYQQSEALMIRRRGPLIGGSQSSATQSTEDAAAAAADARAKLVQLQAGACFAADKQDVEKVLALVKESDDYKEATPEDQAYVISKFRELLAVGQEWRNYIGTPNNSFRRKGVVLRFLMKDGT